MNELQKCAEILVECGYAENKSKDYNIVIVRHSQLQVYPESVDPFYSGDNTHRECLSRRQADAIEDWLFFNANELWLRSKGTVSILPIKSNNQWRLDRIKYCISELIKNESK